MHMHPAVCLDCRRRDIWQEKKENLPGKCTSGWLKGDGYGESTAGKKQTERKITRISLLLALGQNK